MLGGNPTSIPANGTSLLYSGEHFDTSISNYYLRARWYDQNNGRFTSLDPFAGNMQDPQSLHKYLYCHANPVNGVDPSGMNCLVGVVSVGAIVSNLIAISFPYIVAALLAVTAVVTLGAIYKLAREYLAAGLVEVASMIRESAQTISRAMSQAARILKQTVGDLLKQKPYFVFERFTPTIYKFTVSCLVWNPRWYSLTWHGRPDLTASNRAWVLSSYGHLRTPGFSSIDEFPCASTVEGGKPFARGCAVTLRENLIQGGYLRAHYYGILRKAPAKFLVVPVPR